MSLPINFLGRNEAEAKLVIVEPVVKDPIVPLHFNPSEYRLRKATRLAEIPIPGLDSAPSQYLGGDAEVLSMDLLVDTSDELENVREKYVAPLQKLLKRNEKTQKPPLLDFVWGDKPVFRGVLQSLDVTYVMFHIDGTPLRAKLAVVMRGEEPVKQQVKDAAQAPADEKSYVVRAGETLSSIAAAIFRDPSQWREIATANDIADPRTIAPGTVLTVPPPGAQRA